MAEILNRVPPGFLERYRAKTAENVVFLPLARGFLKLEYGKYDEPDALAVVSFVAKNSEASPAIGPRLELRLFKGGREDIATLIGENAVSGLQWSNGGVFWGHTYDEDGPAPQRRTVSLGDWIDECLARMVNP